MRHVSKGVGKKGAGGAEAPQIISSCYYVCKQLLQKNIQSLENKTGKKQLSGYKQCYIYKNQSLNVSKYMILLSLHAKKKLDPSG